ncbi:hypothetical protein F5X98DRAFT_327875, partial [Xylaria grammica]
MSIRPSLRTRRPPVLPALLTLELRRGWAAGLMSRAVGYEAEVSGARERKAVGRGSTLVTLLTVCSEEDIVYVRRGRFLGSCRYSSLCGREE